MKVYPKSNPGRRGLPHLVAMRMYRDYRRLRSIRKTAALHGRTHQSLSEMFIRRAWPLYQKKLYRPVKWNGHCYTPGKGGYLRDTRRNHPGEHLLNRAVWVHHRGLIPAGWHVTFSDGNKLNCDISNLICAPIAEVTRRNATGANQHTKKARSDLEQALGNFNKTQI